MVSSQPQNTNDLQGSSENYKTPAVKRAAASFLKLRNNTLRKNQRDKNNNHHLMTPTKTDEQGLPVLAEPPQSEENMKKIQSVLNRWGNVRRALSVKKTARKPLATTGVSQGVYVGIEWESSGQYPCFAVYVHDGYCEYSVEAKCRVFVKVRLWELCNVFL